MDLWSEVKWPFYLLILVFGIIFCSVFMLKQCVRMMSQLEKTWTEMNKLRAKIIPPSPNLHSEILLVVQKIPGKLNENQAALPPLTPLKFKTQC